MLTKPRSHYQLLVDGVELEELKDMELGKLGSQRIEGEGAYGRKIRIEQSNSYRIAGAKVSSKRDVTLINTTSKLENSHFCEHFLFKLR